MSGFGSMTRRDKVKQRVLNDLYGEKKKDNPYDKGGIMHAQYERLYLKLHDKMVWLEQVEEDYGG